MYARRITAYGRKPTHPSLRPGWVATYVGERWTITTCRAPPFTIAGTIVKAVAPLPTMATFLPR